MHRAEHEQDDAFLRAQRLEHPLQVLGLVAVLEREADKPDVDQVEADDE